MEKQSLLLTSTLKTPEITAVVQQRILEMAGGASPHRCDALKLAFGNTIDAINQERKKIADERKAREEAEKQAAIEAARLRELASRPTLKCRRGCEEVSIQDAGRGDRCSSCRRPLVCSECNETWNKGNVCVGCGRKFR